MRLSEILAEDRVVVDADGALVREKVDAIRLLARLLGDAVSIAPQGVEDALLERERLQSTGIGDGVGIPHTYLDQAAGQVAGLVICPSGVPFDALDNKPVTIVFGVVGPRRETGEHLKVLARISRLLRDADTRRGLLASASSAQALSYIRQQEDAGR